MLETGLIVGKMDNRFTYTHTHTHGNRNTTDAISVNV